MDSHLSTDSDGPSFVILDPMSLRMEPLTFQRPPDTDSLTSLGIQERLDVILKENHQLREALSQNNLAMKSQFDTLSMWQQEVFKTHQHHKDKFSETRDLVLKLRAENETLRKGVPTVSDDGAVKQLQAEKLILVKERDAFREECTRLTVKISDLENILQQKTEQLSISREQSMQNRTERDITAKKQPATVEAIESLSLSGWQCVGQHPPVVDSVDVGGSRNSIVAERESERREAQLKEKALQELEERHYKLLEEYQKLDASLKLEKTISEKAKSLEKQLVEKDEVIRSATAELTVAKEKAQQAEQILEEVAILRTQVEVYQNDYNEERKSREALAEEKGKIEEELRYLRNSGVLRQEQDSSHSHAPSTSSAAASASATAAASSATSSHAVTHEASDFHEESGIQQPTTQEQTEEDGHTNVFTCFKCDASFEHLTQLQDHVEECLQLA